jgi:opacity protein-like surface antigen
MVRKLIGAGCLLVLALPGFAQNAPAPHSATVRSDNLLITPRNGQSSEQLWRDRYECYGWAKAQSGFDPSNPSAGSPQASNASGRDQYNRAMAACLEGRGYGVSGGQTPAAAPAPAPPSRSVQPALVHFVPQSPEIKYHPFALQIDGGYTFATGPTSRFLEDGGNMGLGLTWFPTASLPVGFRIDGSFSRFDARPAFLNQSGVGYSFGHEDIYGGDADVQLDLAHNSSRYRFYLFGGAGWYREQTVFKQVTFQSGIFCGFFTCGRGFGPVVTAEQKATSTWLTSWNAGVGFETAISNDASFFIEGRYQRINPTGRSDLNGFNTQFVPVRFGFRF